MKQWLQEFQDHGLVPYVATSDSSLRHLDLGFAGPSTVIKLLEREEDRNFHEAYLVSNSLAFGNPELKMPNWVYIDCVLMQTAVIGFAVRASQAPAALIDFFDKDPWVDVTKLDYIPVSGQIAALALGGEQLVGFSLFSLRKQIGHLPIHRLADKTKYLALAILKAETIGSFVGISQYDNRALTTHTRFGKKMYIDQPTAPLHPLRDMSFTYKMTIHLDEGRILGDLGDESAACDFMMKPTDQDAKNRMREGIRNGLRYRIADPVHVVTGGQIHLPIIIEKDTP